MRYLCIIAAVAVLASCARIPEPTGFQYSTQKKMQAAHHWNVLARDLANKINNELIRSDFLDTAIFVKTTCGDDATPCEALETTQFNEGFRELLITELVNFGIPTSAVADREAITVNYKVQTLRHRAQRLRTLQPGTLTALTAAVSVFRNATSEALAIVLAGAADYGNSAYAATSDLEAIITTSMVFKKRYFFRSSDIYYINGADYHHYRKNDTPATDIQLTSSQSL